MMGAARILIIAAMIALLSGAAHAQGGGGGGLGITLGTHNPYIIGPYSKEEDVGGCTWRRQWIVDERGRRVLRRVRICY
jgi:hypothetical protein